MLVFYLTLLPHTNSDFSKHKRYATFCNKSMSSFILCVLLGTHNETSNNIVLSGKQINKQMLFSVS